MSAQNAPNAVAVSTWNADHLRARLAAIGDKPEHAEERAYLVKLAAKKGIDLS